MSYYEVMVLIKGDYMMKKEVEVINPMQLRIPPEMKEKIIEGAKKSFRTAHSEVLYRLQIADEILSRNEIHA